MATNRGSDQHDHRPEVGELMSEWWATSNRKGGRHDPGIRNLGDVYNPIMVDGELTPAHAQSLATRPAHRLLWNPPVCAEPFDRLGLVWMAPPGANPLAVSPTVLPRLVQTLDAGESISVHAETEDAIDAVCAGVAPLLGGGHA